MKLCIVSTTTGEAVKNPFILMIRNVTLLLAIVDIPMLFVDPQNRRLGEKLTKTKVMKIGEEAANNRPPVSLEKQKAKEILLGTNSFFGISAVVAIPFALWGLVGFASMGQGGSDLIGLILFGGLTSYPIVAAISIILSRILYANKRLKPAVIVSFLPVVNILMFLPPILFLMYGPKIQEFFESVKQMF